MTEKSTEDRNNIRHYVCTHVFKFPNSSILGNEGYINSFLVKLLECEKSAKVENEEALEHAKKAGRYGPFGKEHVEACVQLSNQAVLGLKAIINGQERAVYQDSKYKLIDILSGEDTIFFRLYAVPLADFADSFEHIIRTFRKGSTFVGHEYLMAVEEDFNFSE